MRAGKVVGLVIVIVIGLSALYLLLRFVIPFLPGREHRRMTISLPFTNDNLLFINPMGETVNHPDAPHGHPGFDFAWDHNVDILASAANSPILAVAATPEKMDN